MQRTIANFCTLILLGILWNSSGFAGEKKDWKKLNEYVAEEEWSEVIKLAKKLQKNDDFARDEELSYYILYANYQITLEQDSVSGWRNFLAKYPDSLFTEQAKEQLAFLVFENLRNSDKTSPEKYEQFQQEYSASILLQEALYRQEEAEWIRTASIGTLDAYNSFLEQYPTGRYAALAEEEAGALTYKEIREIDTLDTYIEFIHRYPNSHYAEDARKRSVKLAWQRAVTQNDINGYRSFRETYPDAEETEIAWRKETALSWQTTREKHNIPTYRQFENDYPQLEEAQRAEQLEWDLFEYNRNAYAGELTPKVTRIFREEDGWYRLFLDVKNANGDFVGGLQKDNFTIYDAGYRVDDYDVEGMESNRPVDVVFVLDVSGSMQDKIDTVKEGIIRFADVMTLRSRDYRLGVVTFVEEIFDVNGGMPYEMFPMSDDAAIFQEWIELTQLQSGSREDNYLALDTASQITMRKDAQHIFILVTDEPPTQTPNYSGPTRVAQQLAEKDIIVYSVGPENEEFEELSSTTGGIHYHLDDSDFPTIMEEIIQKISKQYRLHYLRPPNAPPVIDELQVKVRVQPSRAMVQINSGDQSLPGSYRLEISPHSSSSAYRLLNDNKLYCSDEKGYKWERCAEDLNSSTELKDAAYDLQTQNLLWLMDTDGKIYISNDNGKTTTQITPSKKAVAMIAHPTGGLLYIEDGALNHLLPDGSLSVISYLDEEAIPAFLEATVDNGELITAVPLTDGRIAYTKNGSPFQYKESPCKDQPPRLLRFHPKRSALGFLGCTNELHRSLDFGDTWSKVTIPPHYNNSPWEILQLLLDPTIQQTNLLITSAGVLRSQDLGKSWQWEDRLVGNSDDLSASSIGSDGYILLADGDENSIYSVQPIANREFLFSQMFYASGESVPNNKLLAYLDEVAGQVNDHPTMILYIEGHTDSAGSVATNMTLSKDRAQWISKYMQTKGVDPSRITIKWFGENRPLVPNDTVEGKAKNRRVELMLVEPQTSSPSMEEQ
jgi:outer membrane protein OmpA-like peptidoglycan-associated protein/Mg-chelatase subunit ChlD/outer membrane protein assembly factor BamD (BamD/ComL family)